MSDWVKGYRQALAKVFINEGYPHKEDYSYYSGPEDYDLSSKLKNHKDAWSIDSDPTEEWWSEFAGTFADTGEGDKRGLSVLMSCECGKFKNVKIVIENASASDMIFSVIKY